MIIEYLSKEQFKETMVNIASNYSIYVCGAGENGRVWEKWFRINEVAFEGFIDKRTDISMIGSKSIFAYEDISKQKNAVYIVSSKNWEKEISNQLYNQGVHEDNVYFLKDFELTYSLIEEVYLSEYGEKEQNHIKELKDIHIGKRAFIIGNGPSLTIEDLNMLKDEITFATNDIISVYGQTAWRPTYYLIEDRTSARNKYSDKEKFSYILNNCDALICDSATCIYNDKTRDNNKIYFYKSKKYDISHKDEVVPYGSDPSELVCSSGTSLYPMYQFATYMGIKEIYLLGVDFSFKNEIHADGTRKTNERKKNHADFIVDGYAVQEAVYLVDHIYGIHKAAKKYSEENNIKIYNATRGGKLEIFERVNFNKLFI